MCLLGKAKLHCDLLLLIKKAISVRPNSKCLINEMSSNYLKTCYKFIHLYFLSSLNKFVFSSYQYLNILISFWHCPQIIWVLILTSLTCLRMYLRHLWNVNIRTEIKTFVKGFFAALPLTLDKGGRAVVCYGLLNWNS